MKDFIARFKAATLEVDHLDDLVAMSALKRGLRISRLTYSLDKNPARSYAKVLIRVEKYIRTDEGASSRRKAETKSSNEKAQDDHRGSYPSKFETARPQSPKSKDRDRRPSYTPLLLLPSKILMEIENEAYLQKPLPMQSSHNRDKSKYCRFTATTAIIWTIVFS